jgi:hypothetical protein
MKKITLTKKEEIKDILKKVEKEEDNFIVLIIPKNFEHKTKSFLGELKNEFKNIGKSLAIESIDEEILAIAKSLDIESHHPLFNQNKKITDILYPSIKKESVVLENHNKERKNTGEEKHLNYKESEQEENLNFLKTKKETPKIAEKNPVINTNHYYKNKKYNFYKIFKVFILIFVFSGIIFGFWKLSHMFSRAEINIIFKKTPWEFNDEIHANKNSPGVNLSQKILPLELLKNEANSTQIIKATGEKYVEEKASGNITIYNNYSSESQVLVATTRFQAPNGFIYRLTEKVTVPGAEIKDGKIIPSSITAKVVADKAGAEYNSDPIPKLTIPGFAGSPKFDKFYGELKEGIKGGFIGKKNIPTEKDIATGKERVKSILQENLKNPIFIKKSPDLKLIGDPLIEITRLSVNTTTDEKGNFMVVGNARITFAAIKEKDVLNLLKQSLNDKNKKIDNLKIEYLNPKIDFNNGILTFNLKASGNLTYNFDPSAFKDLIREKSIKEAQDIIKKLPELESAKILIKPFWIRKLPQDISKINIKIE